MTLVKVIVSALIVAAVTAVAKHHPGPGIGGWIAALPIISILSAIWLVTGNQSSLEVARFLTGVLKGLLPTAILLVIVIVFLKRGWPFIGALGMAFAVWGASSLLMQRVGL